tara:strand:- start:2088 stop:3506 length:1419 start_codon:yes stop_codon:yes gene_type:complete
MQSSANPINYTYNRQNAIRRFELDDKVRRGRQKMVLKGGEDVIDTDDLLVTNNLDASFTNENTVGTLPNNRLETRYEQENYVQVNISSRQRQKYISRPVISSDRDTFPNKDLWDEFFDPETGLFSGDLDICCLTFNNLLEFGQEFPFFFQKENQLHIQVPNDPFPNEYTIILDPPRRHVKGVRLVSVEPPKFIDPINEQNNLILLDVINPCTCESFQWPDDMPFAVILIPIGTYTIDGLLETIRKLMNQAVAPEIKRTLNKQCEAFKHFYDPVNGQIDFLSEFKFHMRFFFSTTFPQFNLWEMLGFEFPYPRDEENQPAYVNNFTNLVERPSPIVSGEVNLVPFARPNLDIFDYVYLAIKGFKTIQDESVSLDTDVFAKVLISSQNSLNGQNFISASKVFQDPLDRLEKIRVTWIDQFGNLLDVKGQENSFLLEIIEFQDRIKDAEFSSQRGIRTYQPDVDRIAQKRFVSLS